jgi:hypothetical protein
VTTRTLRTSVVLGALVLAAAVASPAAIASSAPVRLTFEKANQLNGTWEGSVAGDVAGDLATSLTSIRVTQNVWHVTFDWIVDAGDKSFTARLEGTVNTATGRVVMNGRWWRGTSSARASPSAAGS